MDFMVRNNFLIGVKEDVTEDESTTSGLWGSISKLHAAAAAALMELMLGFPEYASPVCCCLSLN